MLAVKKMMTEKTKPIRSSKAQTGKTPAIEAEAKWWVASKTIRGAAIGLTRAQKKTHSSSPTMGIVALRMRITGMESTTQIFGGRVLPSHPVEMATSSVKRCHRDWGALTLAERARD